MNDIEHKAIDHYLNSISQKQQDIFKDLAHIRALLEQGSLSRIEYHSAERLLQVLIESCIGVAKQWVRKRSSSVPDSAYKAFEHLYVEKVLNKEQLQQWRSIIGLRNTLVHDYLNIEREVIESVIQTDKYLICADFILRAKKALLSIE